MAAIYSGIHQKIKNSKIPWEKKLKLARFAWINHQCFIPNKEQVLLDWVIHTLFGHHTKKLNLDEGVEQKLWCFMENILHSERLKNLLKEGKPVKIRFSIAQLINNFIACSSTQEYPPTGIGTVLSCCQSVLSNPALSVVYTTKYELLLDLLSKLCTMASRCVTSEHTNTHQVLNVLYTCFIQYLKLQEQQSNPNRIFTHVLNQLFQPCLLLWTTLDLHVSGKNNPDQYKIIKDIKGKIEAVLRFGIFQTELLACYKEELLSEFDRLGKKKETPKLLLNPVKSILTKVGDLVHSDSKMHVSVVATAVPLLYKLFLDSYCKDGKEIFCFQILVKLFNCIQLSLSVQTKDYAAPSSCWTMAFASLEQLLNLVLKHNIYNVAVDHIRHADAQFQFYRTLAVMLVQNPCTTCPSWFLCLLNLNLLNHLIIEPDLDVLLSCGWIDVGISYTEVRKAQETLISSLLQTYTRLHQFPKLFEEILTILCKPSVGKLRQQILPSGLVVNLESVLVQLPPNQCLDIWAVVLEKYHCFVLQDINGNTDIFLNLSSILHYLMFNMKSLDSNTPVPVVHRFQNLMTQIIDKLICPSLKLLVNDANAGPANSLQKLCDAVLLLVYTWIEVDTVNTLNCSKYVSQIQNKTLPLKEMMEGWDLSLFFQDKNCWSKIYRLCTGSNPVSMFCLKLLSIQKLKHILMSIHSPTESDQLTIQAAACFVVDSNYLTVSKHHEPWSGYLSAVNSNSVSVASWQLIVSNLKVILSYLPMDYIQSIADFLLETMMLIQDTTDHVDKNAFITFEEVTTSLLQSDSFAEMNALHCAFINSVIKKCAIVLSEPNDLLEIFNLLSAKDLLILHGDCCTHSKGGKTSGILEDCTSSCEDSKCIKHLEYAVQHISSMIKTNTSGNLRESDISNLINIIECISVLKPDSLTALSQCRSFFLLLSLTSANSFRNLHFASVCFRLMTCLLSGKHAKALFKLLYASDILIFVMKSIRSANWKLIDPVNEHYWTEFVHVNHLFFETLLALVSEKRHSFLFTLENCAIFAVNLIPNADCSDWNAKLGHLLAVVLQVLCHYLMSCIQKQKENKQIGTLSSPLKQVIVRMDIAVNKCLKINEPCQILPSFLVSCTTTLLEAELSCNTEGNLENIELYRIFFSRILKSLCHGKRQKEFVKSALRYLKICIAVKEIHITQQTAVISVFISLRKFLASCWTDKDFVQSLEMEIQDLFTLIMENCMCEEFYTIMSSILHGLEITNMWENNYKEIFAGITLTRLMLNCPLNEDKRKLFWFTASQIISALVTLGKEACKEHFLLPNIVGSVLDTIALLLRRGETDLLNPHHVTLSFSILLVVPLDNLRTEEYYSLFISIHEVLFSILQCHSKAMLKGVSTFLSSFHRLVASVMHEGQMKGASCESETILKCAQLVERMYTYIAAKTEAFTVFSTALVSQYVHELQKVTLQSAVKKHLTEGIFHIMDLCIDRDVKFLNASLQMEAREVFKELYHEYITQHKAKGHGEEKYTV